MHLEKRPPSVHPPFLADDLADIRHQTFGLRPTLSLCWSEPPHSTQLLDTIFDVADSAPIGFGSAQSAPVLVLQVIFEEPLRSGLSPRQAAEFFGRCRDKLYKTNPCRVSRDQCPEIIRRLLKQRSDSAPLVRRQAEDISYHYALEAGELPHVIVIDVTDLPDLAH